jgi:F-type H+-transporting ATPase subunit epsilon
MADTMQFDLVSPERRLASVQAREVLIPGADGNLTAMPDHASTITTLRPGVLRVVSAEGTTSYAVSGGFAEISATGVSVLAESAMPISEVTQDFIDGLSAEAVAEKLNATGEVLDIVNKRLADIGVLAAEAGLSVKS